MAQYPKEYGQTPVGRIVMHNREGIFAKGQTDNENRPIPLDKQKYFVGIAIEKTAPGVNEMFGVFQKAAAAGYASNPAVMQQIQAGIQAPAFSWKVQDGDEMIVNPQTGQQELRTPHAQGCWIVKMSTQIDMKSAKWGANGAPEYCDPSEFYKGCFVMISFSASANGNNDHTAGIYINPQTICFVGHGEPIVGGPSLQQQFGAGTGGYVPAGMSQTPLAPTGQPSAGGLPPAAGMPPMGTPPSAPVAPAMGQPAMAGAAPVAPTAPVGNAPAPQPGMAPAPQPGMAPAPQPGMADPMMPAPAGGPMPANSGPAMATSSPGDPAAAPAPYGGYMTPPAG